MPSKCESRVSEPAATRKPFRLVPNGVNDSSGVFSPDGSMVAYQNYQSGHSDVFVAPFTGVDGSHSGVGRISEDGGSAPRWRKDGKELFFLSPTSIHSAEVSLKGRAVQVGPVRTLFNHDGSSRGFEPTPDGQRFLLLVEGKPAAAVPLTVVQNWTAALKK